MAAVSLTTEPVLSPTTCDARCAIEYESYFRECGAQISASFRPEQQYRFQALHEACSSLPLDSLLQVMSTAECPAGSSGAAPPPPPPPPQVGPVVRPQTGGGDKPCQPLAAALRLPAAPGTQNPAAPVGEIRFTARYSSRPNKVLGQDHYSTGTIVTLSCNRGLHPTLVNNMGNPMPMACRDGAWTTETGRVTRCVSAPSPPYTGGGGH